MESYKKYQAAKRNTKESSDWMANREKIDSQDSRRYMLANMKFSAEYCGQAYAGATNYHKSPERFNEAMAQVIKERFDELSKAALAKLINLEAEMLIGCEQDIAAMQDQIATAKAAL